jgi:putative SOS response-associated peptidase YedK
MCGRYVAKADPAELAKQFEIDQLALGDGPDAGVAPDYNVAPSKPVLAVLERRPRGERAERAEEPAPATRQLRTVRWGLVPSWAKDPSIGNRLVNARIETADSKPSFRRAFAKRRCILPADGYYEWYLPESREGETKTARRARKQPFYIHRRDGGTLAIAGLYELWRDPRREDDDPDAWQWTTVVLTTSATDDLGRIHDRMPLLVPREAYDTWLDTGEAEAERLKELLVPALAGGGEQASTGELTAYPVSTMVNNVRNNGPELIDPLPLDGDVDEPTLFDTD